MRYQIALIALVVAIAACGNDRAVSPLPIQTPAASPSVSPSPSPSPSRSSMRPVGPRASKPDSACMGAIRYDLNIQTTELALLKSLCFATGAVLHVHSIGPDEVTSEPADLVSQQYEAAVVDIRFLRPGTVTVKITQNELVHTITVVVR